MVIVIILTKLKSNKWIWIQHKLSSKHKYIASHSHILTRNSWFGIQISYQLNESSRTEFRWPDWRNVGKREFNRMTTWRTWDWTFALMWLIDFLKRKEAYAYASTPRGSEININFLGQSIRMADARVPLHKSSTIDAPL